MTGDRRKAAVDLAEQYRGTVTAEETLENPFLFVGTIEELTEQIIRNRDRYGFTYYTVHEPYLDAFAPSSTSPRYGNVRKALSAILGRWGEW